MLLLYPGLPLFFFLFFFYLFFVVDYTSSSVRVVPHRFGDNGDLASDGVSSSDHLLTVTIPLVVFSVFWDIFRIFVFENSEM